MKILIIEVDKNCNDRLRNALLETKVANEVDQAFDGASGLKLALKNDYDLVLTNIVMKYLNGVEFLIKFRKIKNTPVIIVSEVSTNRSVINALKIGADDYIIKPYNLDVVVTKIMAMCRRLRFSQIENIYKFKNLSLDFNSTTVRINDEFVKFKGKNYNVLAYLVQNANKIVPKEELYLKVWGRCCDTPKTVCEVYVCAIRKLLSEYDLNKHLQTIKNVGYIWNENV